MSDLSNATDRALAFCESLPRPQRAALYGAGVGATLGFVAGKSPLRYGVGFALASFALVTLVDAAATVGFSRGCATCEGSR